MTPRLGIILFARMSSSRLPEKMLQTVGPTTLLERVVARARLLDLPMVLATSTDPTDDPLCRAATELRLDLIRGSLRNVLDRACTAARAAGFDGFARLCGDRPFLPLADMRAGINVMQTLLERGQACDLVTTRLPRPVPPGLLTEIVRTAAVEHIRDHGADETECEHVTTRLYSDGDTYTVYPLTTPLQDLTGVSLAVDREEDRLRIGRVIEAHPDIGFSELRAAQIAGTCG
jgi:spore coat polysaccharide biosynthesis protein SpsF